ncbi:hypothetical protein BKA62DRAFT_709114 [Auriculariales sp. MPI-PUGE-AT-0066]|nr:hypothetical protein BKA62DRAFT_709114 [Auriculariales sp. MPI-PUGE-AT-0066]
MDAIGHLRERGILWRPSQDTPIVLNNEKQPTIGAFEELATGDSVTSKSQEKQLEYVHEAVLRPLWESSFKAQSNVRQWKHYYEGLGSKEKRSIFRPDVLIVELAAVLSDRPLSEQLLESQQKRWRLLSTLPSATGDRSSPSLAQVQSQRPLLYTEGAVGSIPQDRSIGFLRLSRYRVIQRILELCDIMRVWDVHGFSLRMPATAASPHGARVAAGTVVTSSGIVVVCPLDFWTGCINMSTGVAILDRARAAHLPNAELVSFALARLGNAKHTTAYTHFAMHATSWARLARVETRDLCLVAPDIKKKVASGTFTRLVSLTKDGAVVIEDILRRINHP